jgi:hypothetical protein
MAGTIVSDTIQNGVGSTVPTTTVINGSAKAWVNFNGSAGTITNSFNVSSLTKNSTGDYTITFTTAMPNSTYATVGTGGDLTSVGGRVNLITARQPSTTTVSINSVLGNTVAYSDISNISVIVVGN